MSEGQLYITNEYSFRVLYFISIFLKRKVQYRVKYEMLTLSFFYNFAYCHLLYRASRAVWMIVRFHGNFVTVLATVNCQSTTTSHSNNVLLHWSYKVEHILDNLFLHKLN